MRSNEPSRVIKLDRANIDSEHICCAISGKDCSVGYNNKKDWLKSRFDEGYIFKRLDARGKVFIEYGPAENAWVPVDGDGYNLINCFWVAGKYKQSGYGKALLNECIKDSGEKRGVTVITSKRKMSYISNKKFFIMNDFKVCDSADPYFELLYKPFGADIPPPKFKDCAKQGVCDNLDGLTVYYTDGCPFNEHYANDVLSELAVKSGIKLKVNKIFSKEQAQNHFVPHTLYSVFNNGKFVTHQILYKYNFEKFIIG